METTRPTETTHPTETTRPTETPRPEYRVIGTRPIRHDGFDKVTGRAKYGADYTFPGMLHGKVLRSPHAHARIVSINYEKALQLPGVKAVVTSKDLPELRDGSASAGESRVNPRFLSSNVLAREKVLYNGHAIAAVAAVSTHIAEEALALIEVEYELLPPVLSVDQAMEPDAEILIPALRTRESPDKPTNVADHVQFKRGDLKDGFKDADYVAESELRTAMVHQGYIEPHNAVAIQSSDGHVTIYCSTQGPFEIRGMTGAVLGLSPSTIKIVPAEIGLAALEGLEALFQSFFAPLQLGFDGAQLATALTRFALGLGSRGHCEVFTLQLGLFEQQVAFALRF